jgi:GT2 family glycosyltransferase
MSASARIAVVVSAHQTYPTLHTCLDGFRKAVEKPEDLIFVDNGSTDGVGLWVSQRLPDITIIRLPENLLFCGGYNAGMRYALDSAYDFILLANGDTEVVNSNLLQDLLKAAQRWPRAVFIGPLVYFQATGTIQKTCLKFPSVSRFILSWLPFRLNPQYVSRQPTKETVVEFLNGVCVLCRSEALNQIGLMDERFGGYVEDADWSWRAREQGWVSVFTPVPAIVHHESDVGYESYSMKTFLLKRNTVLWFLKVGRRASAWAYAVAAMTLARARMIAASNLERQRHAYFVKRLRRTYLGLLRGETLGGWFGPPFDSWADETMPKN